MQSKFTEPAKDALNAASRYASALKQGYVGTEHILAGLLKEQSGVAHRGTVWGYVLVWLWPESLITQLTGSTPF